MRSSGMRSSNNERYEVCGMCASTKEAVVCVAVTTNVIKFAGCGQVPRKQWYA